jgi:hypothetical protein
MANRTSGVRQFCCLRGMLFDIARTDDRLADRVRLGLQHKLKTLTVCSQLNWVVPFFIASVFSSLTAPNLEQVFLNLEICDEGRRPGRWVEVDRALDNHDAFGLLRSVKVSLKPYCSIHIIRRMTHQFPLLTGRGLLKVVTEE